MGMSENLEMRNGLLWYVWLYNVTLFSECDLFKPHRIFGHPNVSALFNLLKTARPERVDRPTRYAINRLSARCSTCTIFASKPRTFKLTIDHKDARFNLVVAANIMRINIKPVLPVVDEATNFGASCWLQKIYSDKVWKALLQCRSNLYLGPPEYLGVDQGTSCISKPFISLAPTTGITILPMPVECPTSLLHVEKYYGPIRLLIINFKKI